jgi:hypothetical protein
VASEEAYFTLTKNEKGESEFVPDPLLGFAVTPSNLLHLINPNGAVQNIF